MTLNKINLNKSSRLLLVLSILFYWVYCLHGNMISDGVLEAGDGITHYQMAHYSWEKPELLLNHWGKPLFTLLSSPFAQFGYLGMILFNLLLFAITSYVLFLSAQALKLKYACIIPNMLMLSPQYYKMVNAGMTEILFGTLLSLIVYFSIKERYKIAALIASFLFFSRPEAIIVMPFIAVFLAIKKQWKAIPLLAVGNLLYSIIGFFVLDDFFWILNKNPYPEVADFYGHGNMFHFIENYDKIFSLPLLLAAGIGSMGLLSAFIYKKQTKHFWFWSLLVKFPILAVFGTHSYLWWKGTNGSLGLLRVIATIIPLVAVVALVGINEIVNLIERFLPKLHKKISFGLVLVALVLFTKNSVQTINFPIKEDVIQRLLSESAEWYKNQNHQGKISYLDPYFAYKASISIFDKDKVLLLASCGKKQPSKSLKSRDILMWDAHFGPNEGGIQKEVLETDEGLELVKRFAPKNKITVLGGYEYEILFYLVK